MLTNIIRLFPLTDTHHDRRCHIQQPVPLALDDHAPDEHRDQLAALEDHLR